MKRLTLFMMIFMVSFGVYAQVEDGDITLPRTLRFDHPTSEKKVNLFIGANLSTNIISQFNISPEVGIYVTDWLGIGLGPRYEMTYSSSYNEIFHAYGASLFTEFILNGYILGDIGYEFINYPIVTINSPGSATYSQSRGNAHALMLAGGIRFVITDNLCLYVKYVIYPVHTKYVNNYYSSFIPMFARFGLTFDL